MKSTESRRAGDFKKGLGSTKDIARRHVEMKKSATKEQREEKIQKKRVEGEIGGPTSSNFAHPESLPARISTLTLDLKSLPTLYQILRHPESDYYYEPSKMYPEIKGPFLFQSDNPLKWLISFLVPNMHVDILRMVTGCFYNISAHNLQGVYVPRLIRLGLVERLIEICRVDDTVYEYSLETLSNMCLDNAESRNYVVSSRIMQIVPKALHAAGGWPCLNVASTFMRAIFRSGNDLPPAEPLKELWQVMTHSVLFEHFPDGPGTVGKAALVNILRCIYLLARESDNYKAALIDDVPLMNQLAIYGKADMLGAILILVELTKDLTLHAKMTRYIPIFVHSLNTREPALIIEGAHGLANLAESVESFPLIMDDRVLSSIRMQFEYCEVSVAQDLLRQTIAWIIITTPDPDSLSKMIPFICRLSDAIVLPGSVTTVIRSLEALERLVKWNKDLVIPIFEETLIMDRLAKLEHYGNGEMQEYAMQLTDFIERGVDYMES